MPFKDESYNLRLNLDSSFDVSAADVEYIEGEVDLIRSLVKDFPTAVLYINLLFNEPSQQYDVKTNLVLPGRTLATGDSSAHWQPSLEQCMRKLMHRITHYKADMEGTTEQMRRAAGNVHDVEPTQLIDGNAVQEAAEQGDYVAFRRQMFPFEDSLRPRIGRWVERYPEIAAAIGDRFEIDDIIEETFLLAFDRYDHWPRDVIFGDWLEQQIDPAVRLLASHPIRELENISYMRTLQDTTD